MGILTSKTGSAIFFNAVSWKEKLKKAALDYQQVPCKSIHVAEVTPAN